VWLPLIAFARFDDEGNFFVPFFSLLSSSNAVTGNWQPLISNWQLATFTQQLAAGNLHPATGNWQPSTSPINHQPINHQPYYGTTRKPRPRSRATVSLSTLNSLRWLI